MVEEARVLEDKGVKGDLLAIGILSFCESVIVGC